MKTRAVGLMLMGLLGLPCSLWAQGTAFTYQGLLADGEAPATGMYDLRFLLADTERGPCSFAVTNDFDDIAVSNGLFTVVLDFGCGVFDGGQRWLDICVRPGDSTGGFTRLDPRQPILPTPYAIHAASVSSSGIVGRISSANIDALTGDNLVPGSIGSAQIAPQSISSTQIVVGSIVVESLATNIGVWSKNGPTVTYSGGNVGIGTADPSAPLHVAGGVKASSFAGDGSALTNLPVALDGGTINPMKAALMKWYVGARNIDVGDGPSGLAFDGQNMWVANRGDNTVTKLRASDGAFLGAYPVGRFPYDVVFDGTFIWSVNNSGNNVTKIRASDGAFANGTLAASSFPVGRDPKGAAFDGSHLWVVNATDGTVTRLRASDGSWVGTYPVGTEANGIAFDGSHIWVSVASVQAVFKIRPTDGLVVGVAAVGASPQGVTYDGQSIWVVNSGEATAMKIRTTDAQVVGTYPTGRFPYRAAFDGSRIWISNSGDKTMTVLRASDGAFANGSAQNSTFSVGGQPLGVAFDGTSVWVVNGSDNNVTKL